LVLTPKNPHKHAHINRSVSIFCETEKDDFLDYYFANKMFFAVTFLARIYFFTTRCSQK